MRRDAGPAWARPALAPVVLLLATFLSFTAQPAPARAAPVHQAGQDQQGADRDRLLRKAREALTRWDAQRVTIEDSAEQINALNVQIGALRARIAGLDQHRQAVSNELIGAAATAGDDSLAGFRTVAARFFNSFATALSGALGGGGDQRDYGAVLYELPRAVDAYQHQSGQLQAEQQMLQLLNDRLASDQNQASPEVKKLADLLANRDEEARRKSYEQWRRGVKEQYGAVSSGPLGPANAAKGALTYALHQIGRPYEWGATGPSTFDCSGLTSTSYRTVGLTIPRVSRDQAQFGQPVAFNNLVAGDLVFFGNPVHHVGMYYKNGLMVEAPHTGALVRVSSVMRQGYASARRMVGAVSGPAVGLPVVPPLPPPAALTRPEPRAARPLALPAITPGTGGTLPRSGGTRPSVSTSTPGQPGSTSRPTSSDTQTSGSQTTASETTVTEPPTTEPPPTQPPTTAPPPTEPPTTAPPPTEPPTTEAPPTSPPATEQASTTAGSPETAVAVPARGPLIR
jgi:cell wall-associated NlpC family hydrolase